MARPKDIARKMVRQGFKVVQLKPEDKAPIRAKWQDPDSGAMAKTIEDVERMWAERGERGPNVGIVIEPGFFVLDVDGEIGKRQLAKLGKLPRTRTVKTSGAGYGRHYYLRYDPERWHVTNSRRGLAKALGVRMGSGHKKNASDTSEVESRRNPRGGKRVSDTSTAVPDILKIDVRGVGGQVVAPGCTVRYADGHVGTSKLLHAEMVDAPEWLLELLCEPTPKQEAFKVKPIDDHDWLEVARALPHVSGEGYENWVRVGMALHTTGRDDAFELFHAWSATQPGYVGEEDCAKHWRSFRPDNSGGAVVRYPTIFHLAKEAGWRASAPQIDLKALGERIGATDGSVAKAVLESPKGYTDAALAKRVANALEGRCRYVRQWKRWLVWTGNHWAVDIAYEAMNAVRAVLWVEAEHCQEIADKVRAENGKLADTLAKLAARLGKTRTLNDVMAQLVSENRAAAEVSATPGLWDNEPEILNTPDGPYDLRTGQQVENAMSRYCTHCTKVAPSFERPERFMRFLDEIFAGDMETIEFVHRYIGYAATGYVREQKLLFAHGEGGNGKGVLFNTIYSVLGTYAKAVDPDLFTLAGSGQHKSNLAALNGKRFVLSQEIPENAHWNEARLKSLSSGDPIEANFMRAEKFEFVPKMSIVICSNPKPAFRAVGDAVKRRFCFVGFEQSFIGREDPYLTEKLEGEADRILGWVIQGAMKYLRDRLQMPEKVTRATKSYLNDADTLGLWLGDVTFDPDELNGQGDAEAYYHPLSRIMQHYGEFSRQMATRPVGRSTLLDALRRRGVWEKICTVKRYHAGQRRYWGPVKLLSH